MFYKHSKRLLDITTASLGLIATLPITMAATAALFCQNKGDVFFKQKRLGKDNREFEIFKFKTMADKRDDVGNLLPDAQRVTPVGRWMRKHGIDELPQLVNILKGDMSFIGPRPLRASILHTTQKDNVRWLNKYLDLRTRTKPGLVCFYTEDKGVDWTNRFATDHYYIKKQSFRTDINVLIKAFETCSSGRHHTNDRTFKNSCLENFITNITKENPYYTSSLKALDTPTLP